MARPPVRPARHDEVPALNALVAESARALGTGYYSAAETEAALAHVFGVDTTLVDDGTYFVVDLDGVRAACGGWSRRRTLYGSDRRRVGPPEQLDPARDAARIRAFFVAPAFARRGLARRLLVHCATAAAAEGFTRLTLMATLPGVPFYAAMGCTAGIPVTDVLPDGTALRFVPMEAPLPLPGPPPPSRAPARP